MKDQKNMYQRKTRHEKSRRIIYKFSYKMGVLNEKRCKNIGNAFVFELEFTKILIYIVELFFTPLNI